MSMKQSDIDELKTVLNKAATWRTDLATNLTVTLCQVNFRLPAGNVVSASWDDTANEWVVDIL